MFLRANRAVCIAIVFMTFCWCEEASSSDIRVQPSISVTTLYDSNAFLESEQQRTTDEIATLVSPQIELHNNRKKIELSGLYQLVWSYYLREPGNNYASHRGEININSDLSETTNLTLSDAMIYTKESLQTSLLGIQTSRANIFYNTFSTALSHRFTERTSLSVTLADSLSEYADPELRDSRTDSVTVTDSFTATRQTTLGTNYTYSVFYFDVPDGTENFENHALELSLTHQLTPSIELSLSGGAVYAPWLDKRFEWTGHAGILKNFQKASFNIGYTRSLTNTSGLTDQLNVNERIAAQIEIAPSHTYSISISGNYYKNRSEPDETLNTESYGAGINGSWSPYNWLSLGAGYSHFQQLSQGTVGLDITRDQVFISLTYTQDEWRF